MIKKIAILSNLFPFVVLVYFEKKTLLACIPLHNHPQTIETM